MAKVTIVKPNTDISKTTLVNTASVMEKIIYTETRIKVKVNLIYKNEDISR